MNCYEITIKKKIQIQAHDKEEAVDILLCDDYDIDDIDDIECIEEDEWLADEINDERKVK